MPWIAPLIGAVGGIIQTGMKNDQNKAALPGSAASSMDLGKMMFHDSSMNNSGWIVTTSGSTANATANTDRVTSPSTSANLPMVGMSSGAGGLDMNMILIAFAVMMLMKKAK